jgi:hypothetical protein
MEEKKIEFETADDADGTDEMPVSVSSCLKALKSELVLFCFISG